MLSTKFRAGSTVKFDGCEAKVVDVISAGWDTYVHIEWNDERIQVRAEELILIEY